MPLLSGIHVTKWLSDFNHPRENLRKGCLCSLILLLPLITKNYPSGGQWNLIRKDSDSISVSIAFHQQQILGMQWQERASIALHLSGFPN
jgi:hypothetical protein